MAFDPSTARIAGGFDPSTAVLSPDDSSSMGESQPTSKSYPIGFEVANQILSKALGGLVGKSASDIPYALRGSQPTTTENVESGLTKGALDYAPYAGIGGESLLPDITGGTIPKIISNIFRNPGQVAAGALSGAANTGSNEQNLFGLLPSGKTGGAIESAILNALTGGGANVLEALRPSKVLRGTQTPEQLQQSLDVTKGTQTPLGDVIGSPRLKRAYENFLSYLPFSGANQVSQNVAQGIKDQGKSLFSQIGVDELGANSGAELKDALKKAAADAKQQKNENYNVVNRMADDAGLNVGRENFSNKAQEILGEIDKSPELKREISPTLLSDIQSYANNKEGNTLKLSNIFKGKLGDKANDFYTNGQTYEYGLLKDLKDALGEDIDGSIDKMGTTALKDKYAEAQKNYQEKFAPFEDPDIVKFTRLGGDSDLMLSHFIKTGQNDRANLLSKLVEKLSPESKELPLKMYLARSVEKEEVNPLTFKSLYDNLGENQKNVLIKDENTRNMLENYSDIIGRNKKPLTIMANPETGQKALDLQTTAFLGMLGHAISGNVGAGVAAGGTILGGQAATKALTSEAVRNALVKKMINQKPMFTGGAKIPTYQAAQQALKSALGGDNNQ